MFSSVDTDQLNLEDLFNSSPNAYVIFDLQLRIAGCNDAYLRTVGRARREDIVGQYLFSAFPVPPNSPSYRIVKASLDRVIATGQRDDIALVPYDTSAPGQPPAMRYWSATHTPLYDRTGHLLYILQHTVDVTELYTLRKRNAGLNIAEAGVLLRAREVQAASEQVFAEAALMRTLFADAPGFIAVLTGPDHTFRLANDAYSALVGRRDLIGRTVAEALPEVVEQGFLDLLDMVRDSGEPYIGRAVPVVLRNATDGPAERHHVDFVFQPIRDAVGAVAGVFVQGNDVTEQWNAERALARQTELLALAQDAGGFGTFSCNVATGMVRGSRVFWDLFGLTPKNGEMPLSALRERMHPEDAALFGGGDALIARIQAPHEYRVVIDGSVRWLAGRAALFRDTSDAPEWVVGAVQDLTERKLSEQRLDMVAHESAHRIKNLLSIILSLVHHSLQRAPDIASARQTITDRIAALDRAQSRTLASSERACLADVLRDALVVAGGIRGRIHLPDGGHDIWLSGRTVLGVALTLHELVTNALKYGALSGNTGELHLSWHVEPSPDGGAPLVHLDWRETNGPAVTPPSRRGFGSQLIERGLTHDPRNSSALSYEPEGVRCAMVFVADGMHGAQDSGLSEVSVPVTGA